MTASGSGRSFLDSKRTNAGVVSDSEGGSRKLGFLSHKRRTIDLVNCGILGGRDLVRLPIEDVGDSLARNKRPRISWWRKPKVTTLDGGAKCGQEGRLETGEVAKMTAGKRKTSL